MSQANPTQKSLVHPANVPQCVHSIVPSQNKFFSGNLLEVRRVMQAPDIQSPATCLIQPLTSSLFCSARHKGCAHQGIFTDLCSLWKPRRPSVSHGCSGVLWHHTVMSCEVNLAAPPSERCPAGCKRTSSTYYSWGPAVLFLPNFKQEAEVSKFSCFSSLAVVGTQLFA